MIELTKSSRVAYESLKSPDKENFMRLYKSDDDLDLILRCYGARKLPDIENTYILNLSDQIRAIVKILGDKIIVLEIVKSETLKQIFS